MLHNVHRVAAIAAACAALCAPVASAAARPDPQLANQWALQGDGPMGAATAWTRITGGDVTVAVVDTGVDLAHRDLAPNVWTNPGEVPGNGIDDDADGLVDDVHGADFVNHDGDPSDDNGHGTHVAGIVAGNGYDSRGVREAIAPGAHIVALKALDSSGSGSISNLIAAIDYAIEVKDTYNIRVINMSLGAGVFESYHTDPLTLAAKRAVQAGIVVVASAGNKGKAANGATQYGAIGAPGNAPWVLTVGASSHMGDADRRNDTMASYSSRGPTMVDHAAKPDLVAPGTGTVSLSDPLSKMYLEKGPFLVGGTVLGLLSKPYLTLSGTSMSAPVVAGTVALMLHANPSLTPNMVKAILQYTAQVYPQYDFLSQGAGFLNARGAVVLAEYFKNGRPGMAYPKMKGWSKHLIWGNRRVRGGVLTPNGTAWGNTVGWGDMYASDGQNIVWGDNCDLFDCSNIVWGNNIVWGDFFNLDIDANIVWGDTDGDNSVWGNTGLIEWANGEVDNIVWGNFADENIVWGNDCAGANCSEIVWGQMGEDNIVWGNAEGIENIVWGGAENIVWGNSDDENITWGNSAEDIEFGDDTAEIEAFDASVWDDLFELAVPEPLPTTLTATTTLPTGGLN
jgi:serine protease AprX